MSLIDEALKRARMEAAQQAAEDEGLPYPTIPRHREQRRQRSWLTVGVLVLAVAGGVAAGLLLASGWRSAAEPVAALEQRPAPITKPGAEVAAEPPEPLETSAPGQAAGPVGSPEPRRPAVSTTPALEPPSAPEPAVRTEPHPTPVTMVIDDPESGLILLLPDQAATEPPEATEAAAKQATESFLQQLPTDGGAIELGGIAWSEGGAFALINGRVMEAGDKVETFTLEKIAPSHIVLTGEGRRIRIELP